MLIWGTMLIWNLRVDRITKPVPLSPVVSSRVTPAAVSGGTGSRDALPIIGCRPDNRLQRVVGDDALVDGPQQYLWRWIEMVAIGQKLYQSCQPENETFRDIFKILSGTEGNCQGHPSELRFDELHKKKKNKLKNVCFTPSDIVANWIGIHSANNEETAGFWQLQNLHFVILIAHVFWHRLIHHLQLKRHFYRWNN